MPALKLFAIPVVGGTALYPFTLLISSSTPNKSIPALKASQLQEEGDIKNVLLSSNEINPTLKADSKEKSLEIPNKPMSNEVLKSKSLPEKTTVIQEHKQSTKKQSQELSDEAIEKLKKETHLHEWLDNINPLIRHKQSFTFISRWNTHYFKLVQWNKDCQCFVELDSEYGIWSNNSGLFAIGKTWEQPQKHLVSLETNPKCTNFNGFWYQDWNTWWRLKSWLKNFDNDKDGNRALASCDKDPVVFLGVNTYFPIFVKSKSSGNITTDGPMNFFYNHLEKKFEAARGRKEVPKHFSKISSYHDYKKLWNM